MICGTFAKSGLTSDEAETADRQYRNTNPAPQSVTRSQSSDGTWTVTATFQPCPANTAHDTGTPNTTSLTPSANGAGPAAGGRPPVASNGNGSMHLAMATTMTTPTVQRGRFAVDSFEPVSPAILASASTTGGDTPAFWGRYFYAPGRVDSSGRVDSGHYSAAENALLRSSGIRLLPICRQTGNVGQGAAEGARDAASNVAALFEVFPPSYLAGADPDVLMFLDAEIGSGQPTLSANYYAGWAATIVQKGAETSSGRVNLHPALYASHGDAGAWAALRTAAAAGAPCDGAWVAAWNTSPAMVDWSETRTMPAGGLPCPVLAWQYSDRGTGFDADTTNPAHDDVLVSRLVMPPANVA